jgi:hypothetical protein
VNLTAVGKRMQGIHFAHLAWRGLEMPGGAKPTTSDSDGGCT